ncbi:hypothetical protein [Clostridium sp. Cult2]|uniref:hypothetical protein n=1 Tax=Clostridium sp. Cult2 TaxID=2079003 RepID=UPI001F3152D2|nr:hypothetical protein [Clostridium sp. Cult2]MCF6466372.1 hypothetical protein [Clostridium sp. Cult2]
MIAIEYYARAVIRHLNGDFELFEKYKSKAIEIYEQEQCICSIGEMIPVGVKRELYEMVS